jgi:hypothetical protein
MERINDCLKRAVIFDRLAAEETNPTLNLRLATIAKPRPAARRRSALNCPKFQTETLRKFPRRRSDALLNRKRAGPNRSEASGANSGWSNVLDASPLFATIAAP